MRTSLLALALLTACGAQPRLVTDDDPDAARVADENNAFTLDVYQQVAAGASDNAFFSPFSMNAALSMTYAGARGDTATEMQQVLHMAPEADHHGPMGALIRDLAGEHRRDYTLHVANRIWGQQGRPWQEPFLDINRDDYGAEVELTDIQGDPEGTRGDINSWVADQTRDRIDELLPGGSIDGGTVMVLVNAIYFKADWGEQFDKADTKASDFTRLDGTVVQPQTMHGDMEVSYAEADGFKVAGLPYGEDADLRLWVVLPDEVDGLPTVEAGLQAASLDALLDGASIRDGIIALPKLEIRNKIKLKPVLSDLGMPLAFTPQADFTGMNSDGGIYIDEVYHEAFVLMDEEGTEAAAATAVVTRELSAGPEPVEFTVDRPYLFFIRDELTGAVLFVGRVVDPSVGGGPA